MLPDMLDRFSASAPFAVMSHVLVRGLIGDQWDQIFEDNREQQYEYVASFGAVAATVADVVLNFSDNFNQAYQDHREELQISRQSFYAKTRGIEPAVSQALVSHSSDQAGELQRAMNFEPWELLPGYRCLSIDGNVLAKSEKRLKPLRDAPSAPMPGKVVARYDLQRQIFDRAYVLLDGHATESSCCQSIVKDLLPQDVVIADRHYGIVSFFEAIDLAGGFFVIRQHGRLKGVLQGQRKRIGDTDTGVVYQQTMKLTAAEDALAVRRITVELDRPTRDGDCEIHLLTNLPQDVDATAVYRHRWEEETAFNILQMTLTCELPSIGHPRAATFLFCMSMVAFNIRQTIFAALFATHDTEKVEEVSHFKVSKNISNHTPGMLIAITPQEWNQWLPSSNKQLAKMLMSIAQTIKLSQFKKAKTWPTKKKPKKPANQKSQHLSTAKLLGLT